MENEIWINEEAGMLCSKIQHSPESKVHGANMGPIWVRQDPGGPHVGPMNLAIWVILKNKLQMLSHDFHLLLCPFIN